VPSLKEILHRFGLPFHRSVLAESVATALNSGELDGDDEVVAILAIEINIGGLKTFVRLPEKTGAENPCADSSHHQTKKTA